ncbi:microcephalin-like [Babylonia areolata]|uniref:microcephalin-like n=1 Tax=Babylonia areolata TaxID=304850 RepID=UPI003FD305DC
MLNPPKKKQISTVMDKHLASPVSTLPSSSDQGFDSPAPSEILKGVVAYVEVRTANDNRSAAVKWVLERMGAKVEEKFSDDVTHVIFKEGKKRTLDKAQKLGVHLVSVLWVDSCKEKQQRVSEHEFSANTKHCGTPPPGIRWKTRRQASNAATPGATTPVAKRDDARVSPHTFEKTELSGWVKDQFSKHPLGSLTSASKGAAQLDAVSV